MGEKAEEEKDFPDATTDAAEWSPQNFCSSVSLHLIILFKSSTALLGVCMCAKRVDKAERRVVIYVGLEWK